LFTIQSRAGRRHHERRKKRDPENALDGDADQIGNRFAEAVGNEKRKEFQDSEAEFRISLKPSQRWVLPKTSEGRLLDLIETPKADFGAKVDLFHIPYREMSVRITVGLSIGILLPSPTGKRRGATEKTSN
jgi:hypothetical protein